MGAGERPLVFRRADGAKLSVPVRRPIKPIYVKLFVRLVEGEAIDG